MFYSHEVLTSRKYGVATVWLVATLGSKSGLRKINRKAIQDVNIPKACETVLEPGAPMALRLQSNLMYGILKVYSQQCHYCLCDAQATQMNMRAFMKKTGSGELDPNAGKARPEQLVVQDDPAFFPQSFLPMFDVDLSRLEPLQSSALLTEASTQDQVNSTWLEVSPMSPTLALQIPSTGSMQLAGYSPPYAVSDLSGQVALRTLQHQDDESGFDPDVAFAFDEEGNIIEKIVDQDVVETEGEDQELPGRRVSSFNDAQVRLEHGEGFAPLADDVGIAGFDITIPEPQPQRFNGAQLLSEAQPFPYHSQSRPPPQLARPEQGPPESIAAALVHRPYSHRGIGLDERPQIRNSLLAKWNAEYASNMAIARDKKDQRESFKRARMFAHRAVFGAGVNHVGLIGPDLRKAHPLAIFAGDSIQELLLVPSRKRAASRGTDLRSMSPRKQLRTSLSPFTARRMPGEDSQTEEPFAFGIEEDIEIGRQPQPSMEDHSSQMPWNKGGSQYGSRQGSRRSSVLRGPTGQSSTTRRPIESGHTLQPSAFNVGFGISDSPSSRMAFSSPLGGWRHHPSSLDDRARSRKDKPLGSLSNAGEGTQIDFELLGAALDVDTQTATGSQWMRDVLSAESSNFMGFLRANARTYSLVEGEENTQARVGEIAFHELLSEESHTRIVAAQAFMHLLALASRSIVQVSQQTPYGDIAVAITI